MSRRRLFFALWPEPALAARLSDAAQRLGLAAARPSAVEDLHVTLCFLGAVEDAMVDALTRKAGQISAAGFELEFDAVEHWRRARVLAAVCTRIPANALALADELRLSARSLGIGLEARPWHPHVTLLRGLPAADALPRWSEAPLRLRAQSFYLAQSQELEGTTESNAARARYRRLAVWPLRASDN
jgi:2'-5' RNA ligase